MQPRGLEQAQFEIERDITRAISVALERAVTLGVTRSFTLRAWESIGVAGRMFVAARVRAIGVPAARIVSVVSSTELSRIRAITRMWLVQLEPKVEQALLGPMLTCLVEKLAEEGTQLLITDGAAARDLGCTTLGLFDALFAPEGDARVVQLVARSASRESADAYCRNVGALDDAEKRGKGRSGRNANVGGVNPSAAIRRRRHAIVIPKSQATHSKNIEYKATVTQTVAQVKST
jgi:hypothetical protein